MKKFNNTLKNLIQDTFENNYIDLIFQQTNKLLFQYSKSNILKPIPKNFFNYFFFSKIRTKSPNKFIITYQDIYNSLFEVEYENKEIFKQNLQHLKTYNDGKIYVIISDRKLKNILSLISDLPIMTQDNNERYIKFINACKINDRYSTLAGIAFSRKLLFKDLHDVYIFLNINNPKIKDSFQHELTHVIQRIFNNVGEEQKNVKKENTFFLKLYQIFDNDLDVELLYSFYSNLLVPTEFNTTQKTIINGFIRMYQNQYIQWENQNKFKHNYSKVEKNYSNKKQNNYKIQRQNWLKKYLISPQQFFNSQFGKNIFNYFKNNYESFIENGFDLSTKKFIFQYEESVVLLLFYGFKLLYPSYNIDTILKNQFNEFRFRDN